MNKIIKTVKKEDKSFDSSALRRANANIEVYSPEELAHFGVMGMRWGVRNGGSGNTTRSARRKALDEKKEEKSINKAANKAMSLANKKYLEVYNAMADDSTKIYSEINNKQEYKGKNVVTNKKYLNECAAACTKSLQQHSDSILGNKVDSRVAVKWFMPKDLGGLPSFYIERVGAEIKHSEDISDDKIKLSVKFNNLGQIEKISLPEGAEGEFISDEDGDDQDENDDEG